MPGTSKEFLALCLAPTRCCVYRQKQHHHCQGLIHQKTYQMPGRHSLVTYIFQFYFIHQRWANYGPWATCSPPSAFFAARQKLLGSKHNVIYDCYFVFDILIDIVLFITVSHYVTSFSKCMCFSAYIPLCVLRKYFATYYAALECEYGHCTQMFAHPCYTLFSNCIRQCLIPCFFLACNLSLSCKIVLPLLVTMAVFICPEQSNNKRYLHCLLFFFLFLIFFLNCFLPLCFFCPTKVPFFLSQKL